MKNLFDLSEKNLLGIKREFIDSLIEEIINDIMHESRKNVYDLVLSINYDMFKDHVLFRAENCRVSSEVYSAMQRYNDYVTAYDFLDEHDINQLCLDLLKTFCDENNLQKKETVEENIEIIKEYSKTEEYLKEIRDRELFKHIY